MPVTDVLVEVWNTDAGRYLIGYLCACLVPVLLMTFLLGRLSVHNGGDDYERF